MQTFPESELILNADGSVYHLNLRPEHIADTVIVVGDPERVPKVSKYFERIDFKISKREFVTHTGIYKDKPLTVISTGIGTDNVEIVMHELDALANIDFKNRTTREQLRSLDIIRIGTSGSIQPDIPVGSFVVSTGAIGLDALSNFYYIPQNASETAICVELQQNLNLRFLPYFSQCSNLLLNSVKDEMIRGITLTCPGFYAPQGRQLRLSGLNPNLLNLLAQFNYKGIRISNIEMETAGYYAFASLLRHNTLSFNAILANRITNEFAKQPEYLVDTLIRKVLSILTP